jgi:hypothetical protein
MNALPCLRPFFAVLTCALLLGSTHLRAADDSAEISAGKKKGAEVAQALIQLGDPQIHFYWGRLPGRTIADPTTENLPAYLEQKYAIKCLNRGTWPRTDFERGYSEAFNEAMIAHFELTHGKGFIFKAEEEAAAIQGQADALKEIAEGRLALETMGLPAVWRGTYMDLLKERHGIQLRAVAGCIVNSSITGHARGFNEIMTAEIAKRYGADALDKARTDAERLHQEAK